MDKQKQIEAIFRKHIIDDEKQIEEIEEIKKYIGYFCVTEEALRHHRSEVEKEIEKRKEVYATAFYNAGYRKINENEVVLTREEAVDLFNSKASGFMTSAIGDIPLNIDGMRKLVDEISRLSIVEAELQELNAKYYNEAKDLRRKLNNDGAIYSRLEVDGFIDKARKETVEKFAERLKNYLCDKSILEFGSDDSYIITASLDECYGKIDEIAKEFTEGKV